MAKQLSMTTRLLHSEKREGVPSKTLSPQLLLFEPEFPTVDGTMT